jgi:hypothetical protein
MPLKKSVRSKTSTGAKKPSRSKTKSGTVGVILTAVVCVMVLAIAMAARESSDTPAIRTADAQAPIGAEKTATKVAPGAVVLAATPTTGVVTADEPDVESAPASSAKKSPVTIAGCLQRDNDSFRLKDTSGADAPKARSWKSGFLKKGSTSIDLVDAAGSARLRDNVGKRVSVTGTLTDRQMQVRSLRRVAPTCN